MMLGKRKEKPDGERRIHRNPALSDIRVSKENNY